MVCLTVIWTGRRVDITAANPEAATVVATPIANELPAEEIESGSNLRKVSTKVLEFTNPDTLPYIPFDPPMLQALYEQVSYLRRPGAGRNSTSGIHRKEMLQT
ncbi:MAG: hypothetical protein LH618_09690, partial [Saprospiraceae bacterium]|nr:hypothetical protein [Saprospiraceae bacterium]